MVNKWLDIINAHDKLNEGDNVEVKYSLDDGKQDTDIGPKKTRTGKIKKMSKGLGGGIFVDFSDKDKKIFKLHNVERGTVTTKINSRNKRKGIDAKIRKRD